MDLEEILQRKIEGFPKTPRGVKEALAYFKRHRIAVWSTPKRRRKSTPPSELYVDVGDNLPGPDKTRVEIHYSIAVQTFLFPSELALKVIVLGEMPP